jgi:hypothetical protein
VATAQAELLKRAAVKEFSLAFMISILIWRNEIFYNFY